MSVKVTVSPLNTDVLSTVFESERSASPFAPPPSLALAGSDPPPDTVAVLTIVAGAGSATVASTRIGGYASFPANASLREHVNVSAFVAQFQPAPPAFAIELNEPAGNGSVTVTVEPSVGAFPAFETDSVKVVGWLAIRDPEWVLVISSEGTATVLITCGETSLNAVPSVKPVNVAVAWLMICWPGATFELIVTSNVTVSVSPGAIRPPVVAFPPAPSRNTTSPVPELNSAASSPSASDGLAGACGPAVMRRLPGTYVEPAGIASRITKLAAASDPVFVYDTV